MMLFSFIEHFTAKITVFCWNYVVLIHFFPYFCDKMGIVVSLFF